MSKLPVRDPATQSMPSAVSEAAKAISVVPISTVVAAPMIAGEARPPVDTIPTTATATVTTVNKPRPSPSTISARPSSYFCTSCAAAPPLISALACMSPSVSWFRM